MRVAPETWSRAIAPALVALSVLSGAGCAKSPSHFCATLTKTKFDFGQVDNPTRELAELDRVLSSLAPADRRLVAPVRDYLRILYGRSDWSEERKLQFLSHFFKNDAPALDRRLRRECNVALDKRIAPFASPKGRS